MSHVVLLSLEWKWVLFLENEFYFWNNPAMQMWVLFLENEFYFWNNPAMQMWVLFLEQSSNVLNFWNAAYIGWIREEREGLWQFWRFWRFYYKSQFSKQLDQHPTSKIVWLDYVWLQLAEISIVISRLISVNGRTPTSTWGISRHYLRRV